MVTQNRSLKRFGVSLEEDLLKKLDNLVKENKFPNRSQAIRFLIRNNSIEEQWEKNEIVSGCVVLIYDHHKTSIVSSSIDIQHDFQSIILSSQHIHLDHDNCMEMIALRGKANELKELSNSLIALKGTKHGQLVMSAPA